MTAGTLCLFIRSLNSPVMGNHVSHLSSLSLCCLSWTDVSSDSSLHKILRKREGKILLSVIIILQIQKKLTPVKGVLKIAFHAIVLLCFHSAAGAGAVHSKSSVAVLPSKAKEFLARLSRAKRNIWDRSRADVQQWIMQFMYMGFDEQVGCVCFRRTQVFSRFMKL